MEEGERLESKKIETRGFVVEEEPAAEETAAMEASPMEAYEYSTESAEAIPGFGIAFAAISVALAALFRRKR